MSIEFRDNCYNVIKQWPNWTGPQPVKDDVVFIHYGDYNEIEEAHTIVKCIIDGTNPDKLICIVD